MSHHANYNSVGKAIQHDSSLAHTMGTARYIDDLPEPAGTLQVYIAQSPYAHAGLSSLDLDLVRRSPGVVAVVSAEDVPGTNDCSPVMGDDPVFATHEVLYHGQSLFAVAAENIDDARAAAKLAVAEWEEREAILDIDSALAANSFVLEEKTMGRGDVDAHLASAPLSASGQLRIGGQDHFYLEGQIAFAQVGEGDEVHVISSTQHPTEVQHNIARVLGLADHQVTVEVRRMGGAFGGKETQGALFACVAALVTRLTGRAAKVRLDRDDDMRMTGKRHDFRVDYTVGYDSDGVIQALDMQQATRCGMSADLSAAIADRAMFHADNTYFLPHVRISSKRCLTHTVSNTAFRGFGGPQGMLAIEQIIQHIASELDLDPLEVRRQNLYGESPRDRTPYDMQVTDFVADQLLAELEISSNYRERRAEIAAFNADNKYVKRGLAMTPVKFGISFTTTHLNQAGALLHVYADGSVMINHGGTEMGQGLYTKVAQIVADALGVSLEKVKITSTRTDKVPNTSATAASSGTDMNGMAAMNAARTIRDRLATVFAQRHDVNIEDVQFANGEVVAGDKSESFEDIVKAAYFARVSLSSTGFYATPDIHYDPVNMTGRPFYYFAYGAALSEVIIDTLTGEYRVDRVDVLHDVGKSINPALDKGQVMGGFIQGMGWLTTEELWWDGSGRLRTHAPSTYKIPTVGDVPDHFNVQLWERGENTENTIHRSKAVGEPPLMLAISVLQALQDAVMAVDDYRSTVLLESPATPERVLMAIEKLRAARR